MTLRIIREVDRKKKVGKEENRFLKSFVQKGILGSPKIKYFRSPLFFFHHNKRYFLLQSFSLFSSTQNIFLLCLLRSSSPLFTLFTKYYPARITCLLFLLHNFSHLQKKYKYGPKSTRRPDWVIWSYFSIPSLMKAVNKTFVISGCVTSNSGSQYVYL